MKKHIFRIMIVMLFACLGLTAFVACAPEENKETFTVTYAAGEGTGTGPASEKHAEGETFTVAENTFTYEGYTFKTWNDGTKDVAVGATYTMPAKDVTFTAQWTKNATPVEKVTVTYSLGDYTTGTAPAAQEVEKGAQVTLPEAPIWADHTFKGWKVGTDATLKQAGDKITVSENVTVTAQWEASIDGYWTTTGVNIEILGVTSAFDVEIALREDGSDHLYVVWNLTSGQTSYIDAFYIEMIDSAWQLEDAATITLQNGKLHVKIQSVEFDLATHTAFTDEFTPTGTYSATVSGSEHYMDFDQWGYDGGNGYMDDVDFVTVGKYVAVFESTQDDVPGSLAVLIEGESGAIEGYNDEGVFATFTACDARGKTFAFTSLELEEEGGKVYLIGNGTYTGTTASQFLALMEDHDDDQLTIETDAGKVGIGFNLSFYCAGHREYEADWENVENTADRGTFTVKLDVTDLNMESYAVLANNSGYGDIMFPAATNEHAVCGEKVYTLKGAAGAAARLVVGDPSTDWTDITAEVTSMTLALNSSKDKVIFTIGGTYQGCDAAQFKAHLEGVYQDDLPLFYFWGPAANTEKDPDAVATANDGTWSVAFDITNFKDDAGRAICTSINGESGLNKRVGTEFQFKGIADTTVILGERAYSLLLTGGSYGHNTIAIGTPVTVTYDLGGWAEGTALAPAKVAKGANVVLPELEERAGYLFKGWEVGTDDNGDVIQQPGSRLSVSADITVTAVWTEAGTVSGIWTFTQEGETTKLYIADSINGLNVVLETKSGKEAMSFTQTDSGWSCGSKTLMVSGSSLVFKADQTITFTVRAAFAESDTAEVPEEGVYSFKAADKDALYVDFSYKAIDLGEGYLDDAEFATVGKFVVVLVEKDGAKQGPVFEVAESGSITAYNATASMALTACEARAQTALRFSTIALTVDSENSKVYLTATSAVLNNFTPSHILALFASSDDDQLDPDSPSKGIGFNPYIYGGSAVQGTHWTVTVTMAAGIITAKFDVTDLPDGSYIFLANNSGYGDTKFGNSTAETQTLNDKEYTTRNGDWSNATLDVRKITNNVIVATSITIGLDKEDASQATKVLITVSGTYSGDDYTQAAVKELLEADYGAWEIIFFWGTKGQNGKDYVVTVNDNGTWSITFDITDLEPDGDAAFCTSFSGKGKLNDRDDGTEFRLQNIVDTTVTLNGKNYTLKKAQSGWPGHNCISITSAAE